MPYRFLDFEIDPLRFRLSRGGAPVHLPRQIFDLILFLVRHRERPVSKQEILEAVWHGRAVTIASLSHAIADARKILGDTPSSQSIIKTIHGRGYWWVAETVESGSRSNPGDRLPFVGRTEDLAALGRALDEARQGRGSLVLLVGEPGIGKSRLIEEFAEHAETNGFSVLSSNCLESEGAPPGWPWIQIVGAALANLDSPRRESVSAAAAHLEAVFPELRSGFRENRRRLPMDRPSERFMVVDSIWRVLSGIALPIVLVVDDLHRADSLSMWIIRLLARRIAYQPLVILCASRENSPLVGELRGEPRTRTIELKGLARPEIDGLVSRLGLRPGGEVIDALYERSSGNPFFIDQLISSLRVYEVHAWSEVLNDFASVPSSVRESILQQLRQLGDRCRELLEVASAIGRSFASPLLALAAEVPIADVLQAVDAAEGIGLIESDRASPGAMRFRHILVRDAVYSSLSRTRRCAIHRSIAAALASVSPSEWLESKAHHLRCAFPLVPADGVAVACLDAALDASRRLAYEEAAAHCDAGLQLLDNANDVRAKLRCDLLVCSAKARMRAGQRAEGRAHLRSAAMLARTEGLAGQLAEAALAIAPGFFAIETGVVDRQLIDALDAALREIPETHAAVRARLLGQLATALYWSADRQRVKGLVAEACAVAEGVAQREAHAYSLAAQYVSLWSPESLSERLARANELINSADATGDDDLRLMARVFRITTFIEAGDRGAARREVGAFEQIVEATRHPHAQWYPPMYAAMWEITSGRFVAAEPLMTRFLELGRRFEDANVIQTALLQAAEISWQLGRTSSIIAAVEDNVARNPSLWEWECALAFLLAKAGRHREARRVLDKIARDGVSRLLGRMNSPIAIAALGECCWLLSAEDLGGVLQSTLAGWSNRMVIAGYGVLCWGSLARTKGHFASLRGDWEEAEAHYMTAIQAETEMEAGAWLARTELALACLLRRRGRPADSDRARIFSSRAKERAERLGMMQLASEVAALAL